MSNTFLVNVRSLFAHPKMGSLIRSRQKLYMLVFLIWFPNAPPRYLCTSPGLLIEKPVSCNHWGINGRARGIITNLARSSLAPKANLYSQSVAWSLSKFCWSFGIKMPTSSANRWWQMARPSLICMLSIFLVESLISRYSINGWVVRGKRRGERGSPWHTPLMIETLSVNLPLTWTLDTTLVNSPLTIIRKVPEPYALQNGIDVVGLTRSNTFLKSNFKNQVGLLCLITRSRVNKAIEMFSNMNLSGMKPVCWGLVISLLCGLNLATIHFEMIL